MDIDNSINLNINFGLGTVTGDMQFNTIDGNSNWNANIQSGSVANSGFSSTDITGTVGVNTLSGSIDGQFYGPNAQSVGGKFKLTDIDLVEASGVFKAKKQIALP